MTTHAQSYPTLERVMGAVENDNNTGFCLECGAEHSGIEPDARNYTCEVCGKPAVHGAEECLFVICP